jgi:hypothetical protein
MVHVMIGNGGDRFCVSNAHCIEFERQGWAKSTSQNVAKAYSNTQILNSKSLYDLLCE